MIAPATTSNCGPALAIMPGIALAKKPRISASNETRSGVAMRSPRRSTRIEQLQQAGDADGRRERSSAATAGVGVPERAARP